MSSIGVTFSRTVGRARGLFSTVVAIACFLSASAVSFAFGLEAAEGNRLSICTVWAAGVAPFLPVLAALLGMEVWSDERSTGRIDLLLTLPVRERDYTAGKFLGVCFLTFVAVLLSMVLSLGLLGAMSSTVLSELTPVPILLALFALFVQGALWCAVAVAMSAFFRRAATAACMTLVLLVALPRGLWRGLMFWSSEETAAFGEMPLDAHVIDIASGSVSLGIVFSYLVLTGIVLFIASKAVAACRLVGRGARGSRWSTAVTIVLAVILGFLTVITLDRVNPMVDFSASDASQGFSQRTRNILAETRGVVTITAFQSRKDPSARATGRLLRAIRRESESVGGARIELRFVDPRWDVGAADRLVRKGVSENMLLFESGWRTATLPIGRELGERECASTIRKLSTSLQRRNVYWTIGHGESSFADYSPFGMSDIARELAREGFGNRELDLVASPQIPGDCALILVAGARDDFSRAELGRLNSYVLEGGRLMVLLSSAQAGGVVTMLPAWGLRPIDAPIPNARTLSGADVITSSFREHPITTPLRGSRIILDRPITFNPSSVTESGVGVDRIGYVPVAEVGSAAVVAAVERGGGAGEDLSIRPSRIVAVGDAGFVLNGQLLARAGANRDFFMNAIAYLSGTDAYGSGEFDRGILIFDLDRAQRRRYVNLLGGVFPLLIFCLLSALVARRRHRS